MKRKQLMQLYVKREFVRRRCAPALNHSRLGHRIKSRVHLDHLEVLRIPTKPLACQHFFRVPTLNEPGIRPAGGPDQDFAAALLYQPPFSHSSNESARPGNATA